MKTGLQSESDVLIDAFRQELNAVTPPTPQKKTNQKSYLFLDFTICNNKYTFFAS